MLKFFPISAATNFTTTLDFDTEHCPRILVMTVAPNAERQGYFDVRRGGLLLCLSRRPFLDSAVRLLAIGHDPNAILKMRRPGALGLWIEQ